MSFLSLVAVEVGRAFRLDDGRFLELLLVALLIVGSVLIEVTIDVLVAALTVDVGVLVFFWL